MESKSQPVRLGFFMSFPLHFSRVLATFLNNDLLVPLEFTRIKYNIANRICFITLSRPEKHNAIDDVMVSELSGAFQAAQRDDSAKVISRSC